jgi:FkbM family methyltransferase
MAEVVADDSEVFKGYLPEDIERVGRLIRHDLQPDPHAYTDVFGMKVDPAYCPWVVAGTVGTQPPFPADVYGADGIEFAAAATALEMAAGRPAFTAVELGAGWGPWTTLMGLFAQRAGFKYVNLVAFEADSVRFESMRRHLALNRIKEGPFKVSLHRAAAWWRDETLFWPVESSGFDAGMAAVSGQRPSADYRGKETQFEEVTGRSISAALSGFPRIDFLHIDVQGSEWDLISRSMDFLDSTVSCLFVGTHSRKIEGDLIDFMRTRGWLLIREKPCQFYTIAAAPTLVGQTYRDGGQFWRNDRMVGK